LKQGTPERGFFSEKRIMTENGLYKVKDKYFTDYKSKHWIENKKEGRPYYYALKDKDGIYWLIPLSKQVVNYNAKISKEEQKRGVGNCIYYHIGKIGGNDRVFIISDMFPVDDDYISGEYIISGIHYVVKNKSLISEVKSKAMRYMKLIEVGQLHSRNDVQGIKQKLLNKDK